MLLAFNKKLFFPIPTIFLSLTICLAKSAPQCSENSLNTQEVVCRNVQNVKDLENVASSSWKQLKIVNEELKQLEWSGIPDELVNLEKLDVSQVGELLLDANGFDDLPNLRALNISDGKIETPLKSIFLRPMTKLEKLDASRNVFENLDFGDKTAFPSLDVANFSHNQIQSLGLETISPILKILHLDFNELKTIRLHDYTHLNTLTLSDNLIEKLTSDSFRNLRAMEKLIITSSPLSDIENHTFESMTDLKILNLSANSLQQLSPDVFAGLSRLVTLDLNSNNLKELAHLQFQNLAKLQYLDISRNSLEFLNSSSFSGLANLRKLFIYENDIGEIKSNTFANLNALDTLDLSYNGIEQLPPNAFGPHTLPRLRKLILKSNNLKHLHPLTFASLPFLQYLSLGFNQLSSLDIRMFAAMRRLTKLHLGNNFIETISPDVLEALTSVKELLLDKNRLTFLSDSNASFENLEKVALEGNPWQCPCWDEMVKWLEERNILYVRSHSPYFKGQKPLCVVTDVDFCVKDLRLVKEHQIEEIYKSG